MRVPFLPGLLVVGLLVAACDRGGEAPHVGESGSDNIYVFRTDMTIGFARGPSVAVELGGDTFASNDPLQLTTDRTYVYSIAGSSIQAVDTSGGVGRNFPCPQRQCGTYMTPMTPIGGGVIGGFDAGAPKNPRRDGQVTAVEVQGIDLGSRVASTLGTITLGAPHPAQSNVQPYTFFLGAGQGVYAYLDAVNYRPTRPWELPQRLTINHLDGRRLELGEYAFARPDDVWGAFSPDSRRFVMGSYSAGVAARGTPDHCSRYGVDVIDSDTGVKTTISPADTAENGQAYQIQKAWWSANGTLYINYRQWQCTESERAAVFSVWAYRDGIWVRVKTPGPALYAVPFDDGSMAVIEPQPPDAHGWVDPTRGTLYYVDKSGGRRKIADNVNAVTDVRPQLGHGDGDA